MPYVPPRPPGLAFGQSVLIGSFLGTLLVWLPIVSGEDLRLDGLWMSFGIFLVYSVLAIPVLAASLALFGVPAALLLQRWAEEWWMVIVAAVLGATGGMLVFYGVVYAVPTRLGTSLIILAYPGACYGGATGLAWFYLKRRELRLRAAANAVDLAAESR